MYAAQNGHVDVLEYLIKNKKENTESKNKDNPKTVLVLNGWIPFMFASDRGQLEAIKVLWNKGQHIDSKDNYVTEYYNHTNGRTPMMLASKNGHFELLKYLFDNDKDKKIKIEEMDNDVI